MSLAIASPPPTSPDGRSTAVDETVRAFYPLRLKSRFLRCWPRPVILFDTYQKAHIRTYLSMLDEKNMDTREINRTHAHHVIAPRFTRREVLLPPGTRFIGRSAATGIKSQVVSRKHLEVAVGQSVAPQMLIVLLPCKGYVSFFAARFFSLCSVYSGRVHSTACHAYILV